MRRFLEPPMAAVFGRRAPALAEGRYECTQKYRRCRLLPWKALSGRRALVHASLLGVVLRKCAGGLPAPYPYTKTCFHVHRVFGGTQGLLPERGLAAWSCQGALHQILPLDGCYSPCLEHRPGVCVLAWTKGVYSGLGCLVRTANR